MDKMNLKHYFILNKNVEKQNKNKTENYSNGEEKCSSKYIQCIFIKKNLKIED